MGYLNLAGLGRFYTGLKGKFLLQSNVVNNLTATAAGKALDGRQGKALKELIESGKTEVLGSVAYTHAKAGTNHNFVGTGKMGYAVMTADYADGDTVSVNGTAATVIGDLSGAISGAAAVFSVSGSTLYVYDIASPWSIPDGDTVATLNDAGIWLSCAGVNPATVGNPTISQLAASQSYCEILMNSANAVNYMIRSTAIQTAVLESGIAIAALDASNPFVSVEMTSNTTPSGYESNKYQMTCESNRADISGVVDSWYIKIPQSIWAYKFMFVTWNSNSMKCLFKASADGVTYTEITAPTTYNTSGQQETQIALPSNYAYRYFRFTIAECGSSTHGLRALRIYGKTQEA